VLFILLVWRIAPSIYWGIQGASIFAPLLWSLVGAAHSTFVTWSSRETRIESAIDYACGRSKSMIFRAFVTGLMFSGALNFVAFIVGIPPDPVWPIEEGPADRQMARSKPPGQTLIRSSLDRSKPLSTRPRCFPDRDRRALDVQVMPIECGFFESRPSVYVSDVGAIHLSDRARPRPRCA
jgi:hypothetical protein